MFPYYIFHGPNQRLKRKGHKYTVIHCTQKRTHTKNEVMQFRHFLNQNWRHLSKAFGCCLNNLKQLQQHCRQCCIYLCVNISSSSYSYPFILLKPMHLQNIALYSSVISIQCNYVERNMVLLLQLQRQSHYTSASKQQGYSLQPVESLDSTDDNTKSGVWGMKRSPKPPKKKKTHLRGFSEQLDYQTWSNCFLCMDVLIYFWCFL